MEASVGLSSQKKRTAFKYKGMWQDECKRAQGYAVACGDLQAIVTAKESQRQALGSDLIAANFSRNRWATAAIIFALVAIAEAIAIVGSL